MGPYRKEAMLILLLVHMVLGLSTGHCPLDEDDCRTRSSPCQCDAFLECLYYDFTFEIDRLTCVEVVSAIEGCRLGKHDIPETFSNVCIVDDMHLQCKDFPEVYVKRFLQFCNYLNDSASLPPKSLENLTTTQKIKDNRNLNHLGDTSTKAETGIEASTKDPDTPRKGVVPGVCEDHIEQDGCHLFANNYNCSKLLFKLTCPKACGLCEDIKQKTECLETDNTATAVVGGVLGTLLAAALVLLSVVCAWGRGLLLHRKTISDRDTDKRVLQHDNLAYMASMDLAGSDSKKNQDSSVEKINISSNYLPSTYINHEEDVYSTIFESLPNAQKESLKKTTVIEPKENLSGYSNNSEDAVHDELNDERKERSFYNNIVKSNPTESLPDDRMCFYDVPSNGHKSQRNSFFNLEQTPSTLSTFAQSEEMDDKTKTSTTSGNNLKDNDNAIKVKECNHEKYERIDQISDIGFSFICQDMDTQENNVYAADQITYSSIDENVFTECDV